MSADRGNKNSNVILFFRYARSSNRNQRLCLLGALILSLEAIFHAEGAIPLLFGAIPKRQMLYPVVRDYPRGVRGYSLGIWSYPLTLRTNPLALGAIPMMLGAILQALGAIFLGLGTIPRIQYFEWSPLRKKTRKKTTCSIYNRANGKSHRK